MNRPPVEQWQGRVFRHIPANSPFGPLETRFAGKSRENRWNVAGEPTLYLASDHGVLVAEFARHMREARGVEVASFAQERAIFRVDLRLERVLDLRRAEVVKSIGLDGAPDCFLDRDVARAVGGFARNALGVEAVLAPSIAFLDRTDRFNVVLFLDKLSQPLDQVMTRAAKVGSFRHEWHPGP